MIRKMKILTTLDYPKNKIINPFYSFELGRNNKLKTSVLRISYANIRDTKSYDYEHNTRDIDFDDLQVDDAIIFLKYNEMWKTTSYAEYIILDIEEHTDCRQIRAELDMLIENDINMLEDIQKFHR